MGKTIRAWLALSRLPFHTVGVLPFVLGAVLARWESGFLRWDVLAWGTLGVVMVMLATYYAGEYWDVQEDALSSRSARSRFAGGSQVVQRGLLPHRAPLLGSIASTILAVGVALVLQFGYRTGPWTLPAAITGLVGGLFYSTRPIRWVRTGLGELWIAFCYGWLPVAVGYYLQTGGLTPLVHWLSVPIALTIFNVILLNEFPDHDADLQAGKANITVRLGPRRAALLYSVLSAASWAAVVSTWNKNIPRLATWLYLPFGLVSVFLVEEMLAGRWRDRQRLEVL